MTDSTQDGTDTGRPDPDELDAVLSALADARRRTVLSVLRGAGSLDRSELAERVADAGEATATVEARLRHAHLPVLADAGLVDDDPETTTVSFDGGPLDDGWFEDGDAVEGCRSC